MPSIYRVLPRIVGAVDNWTLGAGANKVVAVQTDDGDTGYIWDTGSNDIQQYFMDPVAGILVSVASVLLAVKSRHTTVGAAPWTACYFKNGATDLFMFNTNSTGSYALNTGSSATAPGGGAWTPANVDTTEAKVFAQTPDDSPSFFVTWIYFDVTGEFNPGGFAFLLNGLGPLVGLGLLDIIRLAALKRIRLDVKDARATLRALREYRFPKHFVFAPAGA